jgi:hypothetical protein
MKIANNLNKVELKKVEENVTGRMGLGWMAECLRHFGIKGMVCDEHGGVKHSNNEKSAYEKILAGTMMMASGGNRVEDVEVLRADKGLLNTLGLSEMVCADTILNFIGSRRNNARNRGVNDALVVKVLRKIAAKELTYDNDATYIDSEKDSARYSYQKKKQFSALIGTFSESGIVNTVEYRKGNVSPSDGILNQLRKACRQAKLAGKKLKRFRSDTAGYQDKIMTFCDGNGIEYYISVDQNEAVKRQVKKINKFSWAVLKGRYEDREETQWTETIYTVSKGYKIRMMVLRWKNPDPTLFDQNPYCYHVIATNNWDIKPMEWLEVHNGRMGTIEHCHKELKAGLGCDYTPSNDFEKNRGYFLLGVLTYNMSQILKLFYLGNDAVKWTMKTLRYQFIYVCGKVVVSGRRALCKIINVTNEMFERFKACQKSMSSA